MNKDVVYIEPDDDITDIINKIENAKEKIVALVLPDKAEIFHSAVNTKLIAKAGLNSDKNVVLVTTDPAVVKLAAIAQLPITKDLKTVPKMPTIDEETSNIVEIKDEPEVEEVKAEESDEEEAVDDKAEDVEESADEEKEDDDKNDDKDDDKEEDKEEDKNDKAIKADKKDKKATHDKKTDKKSAKQSGFFGFIKSHKIIVILTPILVVALALLLYWAFAIAPAVDIKFTIRTTKNNFSENVTFTTKVEEEDAKIGKFYLEEKKAETPVKIEFKATGTKNIGEKAKGEVIMYAYFSGKVTKEIPAGTSLSYNGLFYTTDTNAVLSWDAKSFDPCENDITLEQFATGQGCLITATVAITASGSGAAYNTEASSSGWATSAGVGVYTISEISGGTDRTVTVVQQSDIDNAASSINSPSNESENRTALFDSISEDSYKIDSSYRQNVGEIVSTPALGEIVEDGVTPAITTTITSSIFVIDLTKVKEYIAETAKVDEKNRIYDLGDPFVESFMSADGGGYTGRLKATYTVGANISAQSVLEQVQGIRIGEVRPILSDAGARNIEVKASFPWVNSVPNDPNKINIEINTEE